MQAGDTTAAHAAADTSAGGPKACALLSADDVARVTGGTFTAGVTAHDYGGDSQCRFDRAGGSETGVLVSLHNHGILLPYQKVPRSVAVEGVGDSAVWHEGNAQLAVSRGDAVFSISFLTPPAKREWAVQLARKALTQLSAPLWTDSAVYTLTQDGQGWTTTIGFTYQNPLADTVYVVNCNEQITLELQKWQAGKWQTFWHDGTDACLSQPIVIPPGAVYRNRMRIWGAEPGTTSLTTFASSDFDGRYRLLWHQLLTHYTGQGPDLGKRMPEEHRRSNEFALKR